MINKEINAGTASSKGAILEQKLKQQKGILFNIP